MKSKKYDLINKIINLDDNDSDIIKKMDKAYDFAYGDRIFYIAEIELDKIKNKGEIILKTGWTRGSVKKRFSDTRNGYVRIVKVHKEYLLPPKLAEELNSYINNKFACGRKGAIYDYTSKTETIDNDEHPIQRIISACNYFIKKNMNDLQGRGKIN